MRSIRFSFIYSITFLFSSQLLCQIKFEPGFLMTNSGEKIECTIKNLDWKNNPTSFKYKLAGNAEILTGSIEDYKEFSINAQSKYVRETVMVDLSSTVETNLRGSKQPVFEEKTIYLKVLLEGQASLYKYESGSEIRYFYDSVHKPITQLIYTKYINENNDVKLNSAYKFQLWEDLNCGEVPSQKIHNIKYEKNELFYYLLDYNNCLGAEVNIWEKNKLKGTNVRINIELGVRRSNLNIESSLSAINGLDLRNGHGYSIGIIPEIVLPFNKNKWSIYSGLQARFLSGNTVYRNDNAVLTYNTIELIAGLRHYFYLNDDSRIFINPLYTFGFNLTAVVDFETRSDLKLLTNQNIGLGLGYIYKKYSAEIRYEHCRNVLFAFKNTNACHKSLGLFVGYRL